MLHPQYPPENRGDEKEVNKLSSAKCSEFICCLVSLRGGLEEHSLYGLLPPPPRSPADELCDIGSPMVWLQTQDMTELSTLCNSFILDCLTLSIRLVPIMQLPQYQFLLHLDTTSVREMSRGAGRNKIVSLCMDEWLCLAVELHVSSLLISNVLGLMFQSILGYELTTMSDACLTKYVTYL